MFCSPHYLCVASAEVLTFPVPHREPGANACPQCLPEGVGKTLLQGTQPVAGGKWNFTDIYRTSLTHGLILGMQ